MSLFCIRWTGQRVWNELGKNREHRISYLYTYLCDTHSTQLSTARPSVTLCFVSHSLQHCIQQASPPPFCTRTSLPRQPSISHPSPHMQAQPACFDSARSSNAARSRIAELPSLPIRDLYRPAVSRHRPQLSQCERNLPDPCPHPLSWIFALCSQTNIARRCIRRHLWKRSGLSALERHRLGRSSCPSLLCRR